MNRDKLLRLGLGLGLGSVRVLDDAVEEYSTDGDGTPKNALAGHLRGTNPIFTC